MTNLTLDVNIIDFPSIPVAMLPHRCSPELLNYSVAKFIMWRKETGLSPVNQSQTFGVAWDDPATTAPEAFRFDICGSVSEPIPDNRYGVSNGELTGGRYAVARHVGELDDISHTIWGIIRHWLPASGEKMRKAPILFHYTNLAEGGDRAATGNGCLCAVSVMPDSSFPYKFLLQTGATMRHFLIWSITFLKEYVLCGHYIRTSN